MADRSTPSQPSSTDPPVGSSAATRAVPCTARTAIEEHTPCIFCGYDLHALTPEGVCPECGRPIAESLHNVRLVFADRVWVSKVRAGLFLVVLGIGSSYICLELMRHAEKRQMFSLYQVAMCLAVGAVLVLTVGVGYLTADEPGASRSRRAAVRWVILRVCSALAPMSHLFAILSESFPPEVAYIPLALTTVLIWPYVEAIAARIPRPSIAHACRWIMWSTFVFWTVTLLGHAPLDDLLAVFEYIVSVEVVLKGVVVLYAALFLLVYFGGVYVLLRLVILLGNIICNGDATYRLPAVGTGSSTGDTD